MTEQQTDQSKPLKLDLGCGINKVSPDHIGVDSKEFPGVDLVLDLTAKEKSVQNADYSVTHTYKKWPWEDNSVDEVHCSHFIEHLEPKERVHFVNELYRILKPGTKCTLIFPHWCSVRAMGDLTHSSHSVSEMWMYYLNKDWRSTNAPHNDFYTCDFDATWGYSMHQSLLVRNLEYQQFAMQNFKEAIQDTIATLIKKPYV